MEKSIGRIAGRGQFPNLAAKAAKDSGWTVHAAPCKACKPHQDQRFDIPAAGLATIRTMLRAGVKSPALAAGKAIAFDRPSMIKPRSFADRVVG